MINRNNNEIGSDNIIENSDITQQIADTINNDNRIITIANQLPTPKKTSIIQEILEGILDLDIELHPIILDTKDYTIQDKIDYNKIVSYRIAFDIYMQESRIIEQRLKFLDINKNATSSQRLYNFVKRVYIKHCCQDDPDLRISCICEEIKNDLLKYPNINEENAALVPVIVFYVFSKCHIFEKPPMPL